MRPLVVVLLSLLAPGAESHTRHIREAYEASIARCTNGVTAPGDVIIRVKHAIEPEAEAEASQPGVSGGAARSAAARYAARLLASRGNGRRASEDIEIKATFDSAVDAWMENQCWVSSGT